MIVDGAKLPDFNTPRPWQADRPEKIESRFRSTDLPVSEKPEPEPPIPFVSPPPLIPRVFPGL
jgi:hypothetical protein